MTREIFRFVIKDKVMASLLVVLGITVVISAILVLFWIRPSDIQIPIRYSGYDNSLYNDRWYERLTFFIFLWMQAVSGAWIACMMRARGFQVLSYFVISLSVFLTIITVVVVSAITRTVTL